MSIQANSSAFRGDSQGSIYSIDNVVRRLGLPAEIANSYKRRNIFSLFEWQYKCLFESGVLERNDRNLLYSAPTSGGKTLVAELLMLRAVLVLKKKAIFILPFVALVEEKYNYFKRHLTSFNRMCQEQFGNDKLGGNFKKCKIAQVYGNNGSYDLMRTDLFITTIEKANQVVNDLISKNVINHLGSVVIDEFHMIGDPFQGFVIESIVR